MIRRHARRAISVATIVTAAAVAAVAGTSGVSAVPSVRVVDISPALGGTGTIELVNANTTSIVVDHVSSTGCTGITATAAFPLTIGAGQMKPVTINCTASPAGLNRCLFSADTATGSDLVDFLGVCESSSQMLLQANPTTIAFPVVPVGGESSMMVAIANGGSGVIDTLNLQIDDLEGNFEIGMPCSPDQTSCDPTG
ncbi:MAG TPA: hypothetical protein VGO00_09070, partial [Kofleriaceae bacterium]|nr:hypothetical protein [Kofleriaceae bacterium]